ncbi:DUF7546 family protein [Halobaculum roseum]|uniref:ABC transporter ATP-binding protein n=1 Tax=Halobaculum roseum TaxID=2175149 RepID=A0ABD5MH23_9EURY|nr:hypothetical protein [Halobaculum roseum]QZY02809.1 hypothetical protein K6T36_01005 [Halobaculum roseum]
MSGDEGVPADGRGLAAAGGSRLRSALSDHGDRGTALRWAVLLCVEAALLLAYFGLTDATVIRLGYVLAPFVWINAGLWALVRVDAPPAPRRRRVAAGVAAVGYFLVLLTVTGLLGGGTGGPLGWIDVGMASPGWGPVVRFAGTLFSFTLVPYRLIGYLALSYLVYARLLSATAAALSGVVGLASCVSCGFSVVLSLVAGVTGGSSAALGAVYAASVEVSTAAFLLAVALLVVDPSRFGRS